MNKIWLCGITQNSFIDISEMTEGVSEHFDGLIFVDHQSSDGTTQILEERKGAGEIISLPFMNQHSWSMNAFLASNKIEEGDWFLIRDIGTDQYFSCHDLHPSLEWKRW